jgi:hypothetical protein
MLSELVKKDIPDSGIISSAALPCVVAQARLEETIRGLGRIGHILFGTRYRRAMTLRGGEISTEDIGNLFAFASAKY